ncbi:MAG TPA: ribosome silencing factor [Caulobacteraceae bacterium]|nr:ribosome silencing factor [Caulobacteraceae bacterium]
MGFESVATPTQGAEPLSRETAPTATSTAATVSHDENAARTPLEATILKRLDAEKASDVIFIDLKGKSPLADAIVIASGRSHRHVGAIADHLLRALKDAGHGRARIEGLPACDWVLIDAGDVIVHVFRPEVRAYYNLEKIWSVEPPTTAAAH